jgi:hypothetical protein
MTPISSIQAAAKPLAASGRFDVRDLVRSKRMACHLRVFCDPQGHQLAVGWGVVGVGRLAPGVDEFVVGCAATCAGEG